MVVGVKRGVCEFEVVSFDPCSRKGGTAEPRLPATRVTPQGRRISSEALTRSQRSFFTKRNYVFCSQRL